MLKSQQHSANAKLSDPASEGVVAVIWEVCAHTTWAMVPHQHTFVHTHVDALTRVPLPCCAQVSLRVVRSWLRHTQIIRHLCLGMPCC